MKISSNYFVLFPIIALSIAYGLKGGILSGFLALPSNLLLFYLIGHPEYSPESKLIAEFSGIIMGTVLGYLSDFFYKLNMEIERRKLSEKQLKNMLEDKEVMLKEIHHRVKNNINLIKSLIQLQSNRINQPEIKDECEKLNRRIFSIALVQDLLYSEDFTSQIEAIGYIKQLIESITMTGNQHIASTVLNFPKKKIFLDSKKMTPLGLIINEILTNTFKYAVEGQKSLKITVNITLDGEKVSLEIKDNGPGFPELPLKSSGLGMKLIPSLCTQIQAKLEYYNQSGAVTRLTFNAKVPDLS